MKAATFSMLRFVIIAITSLLALASLAKAQTEKEIIENQISGIVTAVAAGEIIDNSNFEIFSYAGIVYAQTGYLDTSRPLTPERYVQVIEGPSLFGALFYLHRSYFVGDWRYEIKFSESGEFVTVVGRDQERWFELALCRNFANTQYVIDIDRCKYNGVWLVKVFGYECKEDISSDRPIPVRLSQEMLLKVKRVLNIE